MKIEETKSVVVATSIAPFNIENQKKAIGTWINAGFEVISINCMEESEMLKEQFSDVRFHIAKRDARKELGKPYIYFDDFIEYFRTCNSQVCGIINSDIYLFDIEKDFKQFIFEESENAFLYGSRIDINSPDNLKGAVYDNGFDYFFFDRSISNTYPGSEFCIGQPAWDFWVIFVPIVNNIKVKKLVDTPAYHIRHKINWDNRNLEKYVRNILSREELSNFDEFGAEKSINEVCNSFINLIYKQSEPIFYKRNISNLSVLVVYNGSTSDDSLTYKSITGQTYRNYTIVIGDKDGIDYSVIKSDMICFIDEGKILDRNYLELMTRAIGDSDYAVCGVKISTTDNKLNKTIYPVDLDTMKLDNLRLGDESFLYKTSFLQNSSIDRSNLDGYKKAFVGHGLIRTSYTNHLINILGRYDHKRIFIYGAGGHTRSLLQEMDYSEYNICGIIDGDERLKGTKINDYVIYSKKDITDLDIDYIIISSLSFEDEIYEELQQFISKDKLIKIYNN